MIADPSHYQLLCCKDDDKSYTMQPVDYSLRFKVQGDVSWCICLKQNIFVHIA